MCPERTNIVTYLAKLKADCEAQYESNFLRYGVLAIMAGFLLNLK